MGLGAGAVNAPRRDWEQKRFGGEAPATNLALRDGSALAIMSAMGIPPSLYTSAGGAQRESFRHFHANTILPLAATMQRELSEKLEQDFEFTFPEVSVSDISARSRAFAQFMAAQIPMAESLKLAGLPPVDEHWGDSCEGIRGGHDNRVRAEVLAVHQAPDRDNHVSLADGCVFGVMQRIREK